MIKLEHVSKTYETRNRPAVVDLSLDIEGGTTLALIGPSGCGKTTVLRMINRLIEPTSGKIVIDGKDISELDPVLLRRQIGYVIQNVGLFPHLTVEENIAAVPRLLGWSDSRIRARTEDLLHLIGLEAGQVAKRYPKHLSGGQRQRIGVARALAADPPILVMDEPFGAIDPIARERLQDEFRQILRQVRKTVVIVTHDIDEALKLADTVAVMCDGQIIQHDAPNMLLQKPATAFVEDFVGADRALRRLELFIVSDLLRPLDGRPGKNQIGVKQSLHNALSQMIALKLDKLTVIDDRQVPVGSIKRDDILAF